MNRKVIAISTSTLSETYEEGVGTWVVTTVLCNDGTMWRMGSSDEWHHIKDVPQGDVSEMQP